MSNWLLVELEPDLASARTTRGGIFASINIIPGVVRVVDIDAISRETLDEWVLSSDQAHKRRRGKTPKA